MDTLEPLKTNGQNLEKRKHGIAMLMISMPLLERYLRQKSGLGQRDELDDRAMTTLKSIFSVLNDTQTARKLWNVYRNGFLHQATIALKTRKGKDLPVGCLTHDQQEAIVINSDGSFSINPEIFSNEVIESINNDFNTFICGVVTNPPLPNVVATVGSSNNLDIPQLY